MACARSMTAQSSIEKLDAMLMRPRNLSSAQARTSWAGAPERRWEACSISDLVGLMRGRTVYSAVARPTPDASQGTCYFPPSSVDHSHPVATKFARKTEEQ